MRRPMEVGCIRRLVKRGTKRNSQKYTEFAFYIPVHSCPREMTSGIDTVIGYFFMRAIKFSFYLSYSLVILSASCFFYAKKKTMGYFDQRT